MWAQMLKTRIKPGQEATVQQLPQEMEQRFQRQGSNLGPVRVIMMQDQNDPGAYINVIFFESEARARDYEGSPLQTEIQQRMMQIWDGPPEFTDLNVLHEFNR
jgi:heme-degrading monooxygenase HmoA